MAEIPHVDSWDFSLYPERDAEGYPASDRYRFEVYDKNGFIQHHKTPILEERILEGPSGPQIARVKVGEKNLSPKRWDVTGSYLYSEENGTTIPYRYGIAPFDVREAEKRIGGKPTHVQMGLWYKPVFSESNEIMEWTAVNRKEDLQPPFWKNMDKPYYGKGGWREQAYKNNPDPYKNQERPITRLMEMEEQMAAKEAELVEANKKLSRQTT